MNNNWQQDTIKTTSGIELFYTRTGGKKPTLVLAHGITDCGLCWHQLAEDLAESYDIIMYDAYGHGQSSRIDPEKRFDLAEDLYDLIKALKLEKPVVMGHSMGADTAANFAARYPDMLSILILEDPPWSDASIPEKELKKSMQEWKQRNLAAKEMTVKALIKHQKKHTPKWEESILPEWAQSKLDVDPNIFDLYPLDRRPWRETAKKITAPALLITGDHALGAIVTLPLGLEAIEILEDGEFGHISQAGHCVRYEQYQPYLIMVKRFLEKKLPVS